MATRRIKAIISAQDQASAVFKKVALGVVALGAAAVAAGAVALGIGLVKGIASAVSAAASFETQVVKLAVALKNQGQNTKEVREDLLKFAAGLQTVSLATETQIIGALAQAKALGASDDAAKALVATATDLASATGIEMEQAFRQVNKTLGGFAGELGEIFPELKKLTKEQLQAGGAAEVLAKAVGGAGAAGAKTFAGAINNVESALEQLRVAIGGPIAEVFKTFISEGITPIIIGLTKAVTGSKNFRTQIFNAAIAVAEFAAAIMPAIKLALEFAATVAKFTFELFVSAIELATAGVEVFGKSADNVFSKIADDLRVMRDAADGSAGSLAGIGTGAETLADRIGAAAAAQFTLTGAIAGSVGEWITINELLDLFVEKGAAGFNRMIDNVQNLGAALKLSLRGVGINAAKDLGQELINAATGADASFKKFFENLLRSIADAIIQALVLRAILAITKFIFPFAAGGVVGAAAGGGGGVLAQGFGSASIVPGINLGRDSVPIFAQPGELILPRDLSQELLRRVSGGGMNGSTITVEMGPNISRFVEEINVEIREGGSRLLASGLITTSSERTA